MTRRPHPARRARSASSRPAAAKVKSTRASNACATLYSTLVRERFPDIPRRVSGYNLDQLLPENGFNVARALVGI